MVVDQLNSLGTAEPLSIGQLEANMRDGSLSPMIVMLLRMLTSAAIQSRSDFFAPFIMVRLWRACGRMGLAQQCRLAHACACAAKSRALGYPGTLLRRSILHACGTHAGLHARRACATMR